MGKIVQLFHDTLTKGVKQLLGDSNYDTAQWLKGSYAQGEDSKWGEMIYL